MDFRSKVALQHLFSVMPWGRKINYLMQRFITRSLPQSDTEFARNRSIAAKHVANYKCINGDVVPKRVFEFGSGWDLCIPMLMARHGCAVVATDICANAQRFLIDDMLRRIGATSLEELGVTYIAPCDARETGFPAGSFDLVTSTSVMEHIPAIDIAAVLKECRRLLATNGLCSFLIDYGDHWSYFDHSIPWDNFLKYSEREWRLYNPPIQYQNRLRHSDYLRLFGEAGLHVVRVGPIGPAEDVIPLDDATTGSAWFVLNSAIEV